MKYHCNKCCKTLYQDDLASDECRFCGEPYFVGAYMETEIKEVANAINSMISWWSLKKKQQDNNGENPCIFIAYNSFVDDLKIVKKLIHSLTGIE